MTNIITDQADGSPSGGQPRGRQLLLAVLAVIAPFGFEVGGAFETSVADASPSFGKFTVSGAIHGTYRLRTALQCNVTPSRPPSISLYGIDFLTHIHDRHPPPVPLVSIEPVRTGVPTRSVNLARTKDYRVGFSDNIGQHVNGWLSGWYETRRRRGGRLVIVFVHEGSGTLSISGNAKVGTVSTDMVPDPGYNRYRGKVHVTASWHCP